MTITKKTRLLAKPGPVIHRVVSGGHGEDADALYENTGLVIEGERLGDIESVEMHFKLVGGSGMVAASRDVRLIEAVIGNRG